MLIGVTAAGIIAMIVYVSRGLQGNLRSQADQLSEGQYAPGITNINNSESKTLVSTAGAESWTKVKHGNMNEPNLALEAKMDEIQGMVKLIYGLKKTWEVKAVIEGTTGAGAVRNGHFEWVPPIPGLNEKTTEINNAYNALNDLYTQANQLAADWPIRTSDQTSSGSDSNENGTVVTHKYTDETLGDL